MAQQTKQQINVTIGTIQQQLDATNDHLTKRITEQTMVPMGVTECQLIKNYGTPDCHSKGIA